MERLSVWSKRKKKAGVPAPTASTIRSSSEQNT
jgi:hypothetical protein